MGHDVHFLQRLERLPTPQVELALTMYRDPELVRFVLSRVRLPDGAERVAVALQDRPDSPHMILARDGGFVTCLGAGMSVGDLPVATRSQLDLLGERMDSLRAAGQLISEPREPLRLFERMRTCGPALSREDFDTPDEVEVLHRNTGRRTIVRATSSLPEGHPLRFDRPEDVPDELAFAVPVNGETDLFDSARSRIILVLLLPWVARADVADLYYPARLLETYRDGMKCKPELVSKQLEGQHRYFLDDMPGRHTAPKPGRNQPCPCGSGKKYKRCCGA